MCKVCESIMEYQVIRFMGEPAARAEALLKLSTFIKGVTSETTTHTAEELKGMQSDMALYITDEIEQMTEEAKATQKEVDKVSATLVKLRQSREIEMRLEKTLPDSLKEVFVVRPKG